LRTWFSVACGEGVEEKDRGVAVVVQLALLTTADTAGRRAIDGIRDLKIEADMIAAERARKSGQVCGFEAAKHPTAQQSRYSFSSRLPDWAQCSWRRLHFRAQANCPLWFGSGVKKFGG
jgi:hypothetical protein